MSVIWNKVWFDLWSNKGRTLLAVFSIAAGVLTVGMIFGMIDQLLTGMDNAHQAVSPSHINIILRDYVDQEIVDELKDVPGVIDIDPANQISVRYKIDPGDKWELGTLVGRPDYNAQTYDVVALKDGEWPTDGSLAIERLSSQYYGLNLGDQVILKVGDEETTFPISGVIRHPFVQPPPFGGQANFFTDAAGLEEFGMPQGFFGQLLIQVEPYSLEYAKDIAGEIRARLADQGRGVVVTLYQEPDQHWGRVFVEGVDLVLRVMAIVSLLLSVVLVLNIFTALITQQTDQIGVIKSIGGRRWTIIKIYLAGVTILGCLALFIALPLSTFFAFGMTQWFLNLFNVDYDIFQISQRALILQVLAALLAPLLAALWPVLRGAAITVREAIASYGLGADFGSSRIDRAVESFGALFLPSVYAVSLGNMFRRKGRLGLTLMVLVVAGVMFLIVMSLISSISLTLDNETARQSYDVRIGFTRNQNIQEVLEIADGVPGVEDAQVWFSRNATILREDERLEDSAGLGVQLYGIPAGDSLYQPLITAGRWLQSGDEFVIVISQDTAEKNNIQIGDTVTLDLGDLGADAWEVVGTFRTVYGNNFVVEPIYAPISAMAQATGVQDQGTQVLINGAISGLGQETQFADELQSAFENEGMDIDFYTTFARLEQRDYADNQFNTVITMLLNLAGLVAMVGGIGLMGALGISVVERTREIGVLRAIGARSRIIRGVFIMEGVLQGLLSFLITVPIAYVLARPLASQLGQTMLGIDLDYAFNLTAVGIWLIAVISIAIMFSILPARNATRITVRDALSYS